MRRSRFTGRVGGPLIISITAAPRVSPIRLGTLAAATLVAPALDVSILAAVMLTAAMLAGCSSNGDADARASPSASVSPSTPSVPPTPTMTAAPTTTPQISVDPFASAETNPDAPLAGTSWAGSSSTGEAITISFFDSGTLSFTASGVAHPNSSNDSWSIEGDHLVISINDGLLSVDGLVQGTLITGNVAVLGTRLTWTLNQV